MTREEQVSKLAQLHAEVEAAFTAAVKFADENGLIYELNDFANKVWSAERSLGWEGSNCEGYESWSSSQDC